MLTIESLIAVISLCLTCFSLVAIRLVRIARHKNNRPSIANFSGYFYNNYKSGLTVYRQYLLYCYITICLHICQRYKF